MQLGPHLVSCLLELARQVPSAAQGVRIGARLALPLALRRVRRTADVLAVLGAAVLGTAALIAALLIQMARPL